MGVRGSILTGGRLIFIYVFLNSQIDVSDVAVVVVVAVVADVVVIVSF